MPTYELIVLGDLALRSTETGHLVGATRRKPLAVLAILHVATQSVDRDWLAELLWPGDLRRARHSLAQTLYALTSELGQPVAESAANRLIANRVLVDSDWSKFNADVLAGRLETAVNAYGGPFLDGVYFRDCVDFDRWSESVRERLAETHRSALTGLADAAVARGDATTALRWLRDVSATYPHDGTVALRLSDMYESLADPTRAQAVLESHVAATRAELDSDAAAAVIERMAALRVRRATSSVVPNANADAAGPSFENAPMIVSIASVNTTGMIQPSTRTMSGDDGRPVERSDVELDTRSRRRWRKPKRRALMAAFVGAIAVGAAFALVPRHHRPLTIFEELYAWNDQLIGRRAVSGRIFIETPVLQTPGPVGDSLVRLINSNLMKAVETSKVARAVPRDSVIAVEAAASRDAINSPVQRLTRTDARLGVMTVVSVKDDSVHVYIAVQRLAPPVKRVGHRLQVADRLPSKFYGSPTRPFGWEQASIETHPLTSYTAPIGVRSNAMPLMEIALVSALAAMRSCDARAHSSRHALPWCWERDNEPAVVEGYWRAQSARIAMDDNLVEERTTPPSKANP